MAVTSLSRMTVPLGADTAGAGSQGMLMPKLKYRFRVTLLGFGTQGSDSPTTELTKQVMDVTRPSVSFEDITLDIYNSKVRLAGKHSWEDITLNLRDDATGQVSKLVGQQLQSQLDFQEQASAAAGFDYKFIMNIEILDGGNGAIVPTVLETWQMYGCFIQSANYGDLNYATNEAATIALTIRYDNATQDPLGQGVGSPVPSQSFRPAANQSGPATG
jgi:hypothetical protein